MPIRIVRSFNVVYHTVRPLLGAVYIFSTPYFEGKVEEGAYQLPAPESRIIVGCMDRVLPIWFWADEGISHVSGNEVHAHFDDASGKRHRLELNVMPKLLRPKVEDAWRRTFMTNGKVNSLNNRLVVQVRQWPNYCWKELIMEDRFLIESMPIYERREYYYKILKVLSETQELSQRDIANGIAISALWYILSQGIEIPSDTKVSALFKIAQDNGLPYIDWYAKNADLIQLWVDSTPLLHVTSELPRLEADRLTHIWEYISAYKKFANR